MSTPAIHVADPNVTPELAQVVQPVSVIFGNQQIGAGQLVTTPSNINVTGHYQWPPDAPAEVEFSFDFHILSSNTCTVEVDWPGLVPTIDKTPASYIMLLLMARPEFLITTPKGDKVNAAFLGPYGQPQITTDLQVAVASQSSAASVSLLFHYDTPPS